MFRSDRETGVRFLSPLAQPSVCAARPGALCSRGWSLRSLQSLDPLRVEVVIYSRGWFSPVLTSEWIMFFFCHV